MKIFGSHWHKDDGFKYLMFLVFSPMRRFFKSVGRVFVWLPIIWKDRDWDYDYLYEVLKKKLQLMSKYEKKYACAEKSEDVAKQMDEVISLIEKQQDGYHDEAFKEFYDIYPDFESDVIFNDDPSHKEWSTIEFKYDSEEQEKLYSKCLHKLPKLGEDGKNRLFDLIKENINGWWD